MEQGNQRLQVGLLNMMNKKAQNYSRSQGAPPPRKRAKPLYHWVWTELRGEGLQRMTGNICLYPTSSVPSSWLGHLRPLTYSWFQARRPPDTSRLQKQERTRRRGTVPAWTRSHSQNMQTWTEVAEKGRGPLWKDKLSAVKLQIFLRTLLLLIIKAPPLDLSTICMSAEFGPSDFTWGWDLPQREPGARYKQPLELRSPPNPLPPPPDFPPKSISWSGCK